MVPLIQTNTNSIILPVSRFGLMLFGSRSALMPPIGACRSLQRSPGHGGVGHFPPDQHGATGLDIQAGAVTAREDDALAAVWGSNVAGMTALPDRYTPLLKPAGLRLRAAIAPVSAIDGLSPLSNRLQQGPSYQGQLDGIGGDGGPEAALGGKRQGGAGLLFAGLLFQTCLHQIPGVEALHGRRPQAQLP